MHLLGAMACASTPEWNRVSGLDAHPAAARGQAREDREADTAMQMRCTVASREGAER
jgi:hypothetical protein